MEKMVLSILSATKIMKKSLYVLTPEIKYVENFDDAKPYPAKLDMEIIVVKIKRNMEDNSKTF